MLDNACEKCMDNCLVCLTPEQCILCFQGFDLYKGICLETLKENSDIQTYIKIKKMKTMTQLQQEIKTKKSLVEGCELESINNPEKCYICKNGYFRNSNYVCQKCSDNCTKCLSQKFCYKCQYGFDLKAKALTSEYYCYENKVKIK
jgi:hypothetical protein